MKKTESRNSLSRLSGRIRKEMVWWKTAHGGDAARADGWWRARKLTQAQGRTACSEVEERKLLGWIGQSDVAVPCAEGGS
jgi:hypothetical protein